jgi:hypothetical protein
VPEGAGSVGTGVPVAVATGVREAAIVAVAAGVDVEGRGVAVAALTTYGMKKGVPTLFCPKIGVLAKLATPASRTSATGTYSRNQRTILAGSFA